MRYGNSCRKCGWNKPTVADLTRPVPTLDYAALTASIVRKANAEVPQWIKDLPIADCIKQAHKFAAEKPAVPGRDWMNRLKSRIADGENVPFISRQIVERMEKWTSSE